MSYEIIKALGAAQETTDVANLLGEIASNLRMGCYTFWAVNVPGRPVRDPWAISNAPREWSLEYLEKGYSLIDPVATSAARHIVPFAWGGSDYLGGLTRQQQQVFSDAKKYGIFFGILVPIHAPGNEFAAISMVAKETETEEEFNLELHQRTLTLISLAPYIHSAVRRILNVDEQTTAAHSLSPREVECLSWIAHGKSYEDIAQILSISRNTVITHVNRAKVKLAVNTPQQAVSLLISSGLANVEAVGTNI